MQFRYVVALFMMCVSAQATDPRSFGEHDPLNTKAAFCEMAQNHTGTQAEMFYRTAGLFDILNVCRKAPKEVKKYDFDKGIFSQILVKKIEHKENYVQALPAEKQQAWEGVEKTFKEARKAYKGTSTYPVSKFLYIREDYGPDTPAACSTILNTARVFVNPTSNTFTTYFDRYADNLEMKNTAKQSSEKVTQIVADPKVSFFKKTLLKGALGLINFGARSFEDRMQVSQDKIQAILFHELSHPYTNELCDHLNQNKPSAEPKENACIEAYCNTLAVLNSPHPLRTARTITSGYHSDHIPALAKALKKEGVKE